MERPSIWFMLVILLAAILFLREPRLQRFDETFLRWLLKNSPARSGIVPLTIVDIGRSEPSQKKRADNQDVAGGGTSLSPVEFALFLQAALEFKPNVIGFETILQWPPRDTDQEQIFLDQAMHVPKLLLAAELTASPDLDAPVVEVPGFQNVTGRRGVLPEFSGISQQPEEDLRLISTLGFTNLPRDVTSDVRVPLLFLYRGEVIPSFALQAAMLWMRITPAEVKIDIGSFIFLPNGMKIPIQEDGTALISPYEIKRARELNLNELLLAAQQHESKSKRAKPGENPQDEIILARTAGDQQPSQDILGATIATILDNSFVRRASRIFDCVFILVVVAVSGMARKFSRIDVILAAFALTAAYCLTTLAILTRWSFWLPGVLPLGTIWLGALFCLFAPRRKDDPDLPTVAPSPPSL
jgi:hypothetical protein